MPALNGVSTKAAAFVTGFVFLLSTLAWTAPPPSNKKVYADTVRQQTEMNKDPNTARQEVEAEVLAGVKRGEFKADPELMLQIAGAKSLGAAPVSDWSLVLNKSVLIPPIAPDKEVLFSNEPEIIQMIRERLGSDFPDVLDGVTITFVDHPSHSAVLEHEEPVGKVLKIDRQLIPAYPLLLFAVTEVLFAEYLKELPDKPLLKLAALNDALSFFPKMYTDKDKWAPELKLLMSRLEKDQNYFFRALFKHLEDKISKSAEFEYDDDYARLMVKGLGEVLRKEPRYASDIKVLKKLELEKLRGTLSEIIRYARAKAGVTLIKNADREDKLSIEFIRNLPQDQFKNALVLLAKRDRDRTPYREGNVDDQTILCRIGTTVQLDGGLDIMVLAKHFLQGSEPELSQISMGNYVDTKVLVNHILQGLEPELPQIALLPEDAVRAIFIFCDRPREQRKLTKMLLEMSRNAEYPPALRKKLTKTWELAKKRLAEILSRLKAPRPKPVTLGDMMDRRIWEEENGPASKFVVEIPPEAHAMVWAVYAKLKKGESPANLARELAEIAEKGPLFREAVFGKVNQFVLNGPDGVPIEKLRQVQEEFLRLIRGSSLGVEDSGQNERIRTLLIPLSPGDDSKGILSEAGRFLSETKNTAVTFLAAGWTEKKELEHNPLYIDVSHRFGGRVQIEKNKLSSTNDFGNLEKFVKNRSRESQTDFAFIAPLETLEKVAALEGMIKLASDKVQDKNGAQPGNISELEYGADREKVFSALFDTAWQALSAGSGNVEFLNRTRQLGRTRIYVITSEYLAEWLEHLFAEHSYTELSSSSA